MDLVDVIEVGMMDLDGQGILVNYIQEMMESPLKRLPVLPLLTKKGDILMNILGHTITLKLKKFLQDNGIDMSKVHHTRLVALQCKTANALGETIKKSVDKDAPVLEYDTIKRIARVIEGDTDGIWFIYESETYMKVYYLQLLVEKVIMDNTGRFWQTFSKRLAKFGVYRDAKSCKAREAEFAKEYAELKKRPTGLLGLDRLVYHVMSACAHLNPPVLGSVSGIRTSGGRPSRLAAALTLPNQVRSTPRASVSGGRISAASTGQQISAQVGQRRSSAAVGNTQALVPRTQMIIQRNSVNAAPVSGTNQSGTPVKYILQRRNVPVAQSSGQSRVQYVSLLTAPQGQSSPANVTYQGQQSNFRVIRPKPTATATSTSINSVSTGGSSLVRVSPGVNANTMQCSAATLDANGQSAETSWPPLKTFTPGKKTSAQECVEMIKDMRETNKETRTHLNTVMPIITEQIVWNNMNRYYAPRHMCNNNCPYNCRRNFN